MRHLPLAIKSLTLIGLASTTIIACAAPSASMNDPKHDDPVAQAESHPQDASDIMADVVNARETMRRYGIAEPNPKPAGAVRLVAYNIENLFDDVDDPTLSDRNEDIDDLKPFHQRVAVAEAIRLIDADILCMQEIESLEALEWFRDEFLGDMGYDYIVSLDAGNARGIENAVLSRYPLSEGKVWVGKLLGGIHPELYGTRPNRQAGEKIAFRRSPLQVDVQMPGAEGQDPWTLSLFVEHHKSGRYNSYWREAEAKMIVQLANEITDEHPDRAIIILGDFNAQVTDESVKIYLRSGFQDLFANRSDEGAAIVTHESSRRIDLILSNDAAMGHLLVDQAFVLGTAARPAEINWRDLDTFMGYASDHYPVVVDVVPSLE
ncbi:MAG: endonuclease/exonuclease/phosphatase family protein [Phycisphaerales bacterium]|nr:endonuclease/exonuclease/phosphatase family protein [Phycisphaerales bacterium]